MKVDVLDLGSGNVRSVSNWLTKSGCAVRLVRSPYDLNSELLVMPGVGSARSYMQRLVAQNFHIAIKEHVDEGRRLMGICLGFQIMMDYSQEGGHVACLGLLEGCVDRLPFGHSHNGWEPLNFSRRDLDEHSFGDRYDLSKKRLFRGRVFYNHEYGVVCGSDKTFNLPISPKHERFSAICVKRNLLGVQFHPEKSQVSGVELLNLIL